MDDESGDNAATTGNGHGVYDAIARARRALEPPLASLRAAGFYAYGGVDDQNRWGVAADDEDGHVDVRVGQDGLEIELWATSPGLYAEEELDFRRRAMERLARMLLVNVNRGLLEPHQSARWDDAEGGVQVRIRYELPFTREHEVGAFVRERLPELDALLTYVESQIAS
ncbi:MAG TPA: hypothetical protein VFX03_07695 [Thermomicrobiales bacterium]|nr:hypothetical protein [Thermomicrobiales bacterium]